MKSFRLWLAGIVAGKETEEIREKKKQQILEKIYMKVKDMAAFLASIDKNLEEASVEIPALVQQLRDALGDADVPAEAEEILNKIAARGKALADIVPNPPVENNG